jgi:hypothetical protein
MADELHEHSVKDILEAQQFGDESGTCWNSGNRKALSLCLFQTCLMLFLFDVNRARPIDEDEYDQNRHGNIQ